jgi:hypothetical protein
VACHRAQWPTSRQLCGRIQVVGTNSLTILKNTDLVVYRSRSERIQCCSDADVIADIQTDESGSFNSGKLRAGRYFVVVTKSPEIVFPVYLETQYDGQKCTMDPVFSFDRETGKTEQIMTIMVDRTKLNAETH